jgi:membrane-associated phospholipid phosphatase
VARPARRDAVAIAIGVALLGVSWIAAASRAVPAWEAWLFHRVNDLPDALWPLLRVPMQLGTLVGSFAVVAITALCTRNRRLALAALAGSQAAYWLAKAVKHSVGRDRPALLLHGVHVHETAGGFGYVSAHTAVAVALAAAIAPSFPRAAQVIAVVLVVLVGFARIYAGAHLPLDVVGGAGLGLVCGTVARVAFRVE